MKAPTMHQIYAFSLTSHEPLFFVCFSSASSLLKIISRNHKPRSLSSSKPNLKRLTSRIVQLTRRHQLHQIFKEIEIAKRRYEKLNTIVMNAVLEACVHCGNIDADLKVFDEMSKPGSCGVDTVSYATLLKVWVSAEELIKHFTHMNLLSEVLQQEVQNYLHHFYMVCRMLLLKQEIYAELTVFLHDMVLCFTKVAVHQFRYITH